ncbi:hypothetical protein SAMN03097699_0711 [Flavobacteriaceae bacterium MAR_2010_188]|nr:hypothetical protein SAMN03097699_0711 [Flavobacteriaceae bacterium MAR_2010_188]
MIKLKNKSTIIISKFPLKRLVALMSACFLVIVTTNCERDDICPATTSTTPNVLFQFFDINNQTASKVVNGLSVRAIGVDDYVLFNSDVSTASVPLNFEEEGVLRTIRFEVTKDSEFFADDQNDETNPNTDIIKLTYTPEFVYVSRACGYKAIYNDVQLTIENDGDNWIFNYDILINNIENEDEPHITLYH